ncbi:hypothetical protein HNP82_000991 [Catenibacillus scindens]|uniref:Uncharacterized protein n=1 Tax=Catenibacillus scindens TaxID=673271 RepID=A0A7W8H8L2_9FIRM|nr:hypothetical protein [Catenibacillus scindens]
MAGNELPENKDLKNIFLFYEKIRDFSRKYDRKMIKPRKFFRVFIIYG